MANIHPLAVVDSNAVLGSDISIGPFAVIHRGVTIGDGCRLASHVVVKEGTSLGKDNEVSEGVVLGGKPQHLQAGQQLGRLLIGNGNTIRENATLHRGLTTGSDTIVGDNNLIMVNVHIAHDCQLGNHLILANNVMMAGHVTLGDHAYLSGGVAIHQFCRIGAYTMVGGQAHIKRDVPPYVTVDGNVSQIVGLNLIGLRRNHFSVTDIRQLKAAYRTIYRSGLKWSEVLTALKAQYFEGPAADFHAFLSQGKRGFLPERSTPRAATLRIAEVDESPADNQAER